MIALLGHLCILAALVVAVVGAVASFGGMLTLSDDESPSRGKSDRWPDGLVTVSRRAPSVVAAFLILAVLLMEIALLTHDFHVSYVAEVGSRETPLYYTVISLWAALEGSILFWAFVLSLYTVAFLRIYRDRMRDLRAGVTGVLLAVSSFFLLVIAGPGDPFAPRNPAPLDGPGPNVLLQNHPMMGLHPPLLYLGYVGLAVPFAIAIAALLRGSAGPEVMRAMRQWAIVPWVCLSLGIVAGMWWSYAVLGWGGYWSWDPVENASVMPWLVTTAFLHSIQVQERRHMLKTWTVSLILAAFLLSILGTFLTRSGVIVSVHSFTQTAIGPLFLAFFSALLVGSIGLLLARSRVLASSGTLDGVVCRETAFLLNNLLFVAITFTILLGTLFPLIVEAYGGTLVSVGAPYFDHVAVPIGFALLFLMGIGPVLPWGATRMEELQYRLLWPVACGVATILLLLLIGVRGIGALVTFGASAFVLAVTLGRVGADIRIRRGNSREGRFLSGLRLVRASPRRYGGFLVHIGVLLAIVGIAASQTYGMRNTATLRPGGRMAVGQYHLVYRDLVPHAGSGRMSLEAVVDVYRSGSLIGTLTPSENFYTGRQQTVVTPAVREEPWGMGLGVVQGHSPLPDLAQLLQRRNPFEDLYLVLQAQDVKKTITLQALVNPMVGFIWLGGMIVGAGGVIALLPARRRKRVADVQEERFREPVARPHEPAEVAGTGAPA